MQVQKKLSLETWIFLAWFTAAVAMAGSLFFSEVMKFPPCVLCWYQRIGMYPLVLLLLPAVFTFEKQVFKYTLPLAISGWLVSVYHNLLYYKILPESASPCVQGISCTTEYIEWLGFITIPLLSLSAFTIIISTLIFCQRKDS